jgi:FAD/FMN-containing dehydrogenase
MDLSDVRVPLDVFDAELTGFAAEVGSVDLITCVGGRTQWHIGGVAHPVAREVSAPTGVVAYEPAEMTVRVRAGTTVAALAAVLAEGGQMVPLDPRDPARATVGGVLAAGESGLRRLRYGPVRDTLLEARFVNADGRVVKAGGPVVKNVSGFDLCRVLVGSFGTLGFLGEVVLRVQPLPVTSQWFAGEADPFAARRRLFRPSSVLWNGTMAWVLLEGHPADIAAEAAALGSAFAAADEPPPLVGAQWRRSCSPAALEAHPAWTGDFVAEVGVGTVHCYEPQLPVEPDRSTLDLHKRLKVAFDPAGRLNPGRSVCP